MVSSEAMSILEWVEQELESDRVMESLKVKDRIVVLLLNADSVGDDVALEGRSTGTEVEVKVEKVVDNLVATFVKVVVVDRDCRPHRHRLNSNLRHCQIRHRIGHRLTKDRTAIQAGAELANVHPAD